MRQVFAKIFRMLLSVPIRVKVFGIVVVPILILGLSLNYWVTTGLSDWLSYLVDDESVFMAMEAGSRSVLLVSVLAAIAGILFTIVMMFWLTQPLLELRKAAYQVTEGNLESRANVWANDEIGAVAGSFNHMLDHLVSSQQSLKQSNEQLFLMNKVTWSTTKDLEIHDALYEILGYVLDSLELETGWIYLYDYERNQFHLATWKGVLDEDKPVIILCDTETLCDCQKKLVSGDQKVETLILSCSRKYNDGRILDKNHISLLLTDGAYPLGIMNLLIPPDRKIMGYEIDLLNSIATQISEYTSKSWLEMKLEQKESARRKLMKALIQAQEAERSRLAQELHDGAGQVLTSLLVRMKALERDIEDKAQSRKVEHLCTNISDVIEHIRQISYQNRPIVLEELGLKHALENLIGDMVTNAGLESKVDIDLGKVKLPKEIETTIYRITQETLTNALRHAKASMITLRLWADAGILNLMVKDDGIGFGVEQQLSQNSDRHLGLITIKDRLELLGGELEIQSGEGEGTELLAVLPLLEVLSDD